MLTDPRFKILCAANVVFAIGAFEDIHVSFHFVFNWWSDKYQGKRNAILSHVGAWAPKAEQIATADYLKNKTALNNFLGQFKQAIDERLHGFYDGFVELKEAGYNVDAISPQAAIYLTINFDLKGKKNASGKVLSMIARGPNDQPTRTPVAANDFEIPSMKIVYSRILGRKEIGS